MIEFKPQMVQIYQSSLNLRTDTTRVQAPGSFHLFSGHVFFTSCFSSESVGQVLVYESLVVIMLLLFMNLVMSSHQ